MQEVDLTEKIVSVPFSAPISIAYDQSTNSLLIENAHYDPRTPRVKMRAVFHGEAIHQLVMNLKKIEAAMQREEMPPAETDFLDETNIL